MRGVRGCKALLPEGDIDKRACVCVCSSSIALSADAEPVKLSQYVTTLPETHSIAIFIGAMARGEDSFADEVVDQKISISKYSLSASVACGKFCCAIVS